MAIEFLFVYGTLCRRTSGETSHAFMQFCEFLSTGLIQARLYEVDGYPGAILTENPNDRVFGEVFKITDAETLFACLDVYEECTDEHPMPHEYRRQNVPVLIPAGNRLTACAYLYNHDVANLECIPSGDYLSYLKASP